MAKAINTARVKGRRQLRFDGVDEIAAELDRLAAAGEIRALGNWSAGEVCQHLALVVNKSIDGFKNPLPLFLRLVLRPLFKRRFMNQTMSAGYRLPKKSFAEFGPSPTTFEEAVQNLRRALARLKTETKRMPHPAFGRLTSDEWERFHCRHSELHLSFLVTA